MITNNGVYVGVIAIIQITILQSLSHGRDSKGNENRMYLLSNVMARMEKDGIDQVKYKVIDRMMTDVYTKITVDLYYKDYISTYVSTTTFQCAPIRWIFFKNYLIFSINSIQVLPVFVVYIYRTILHCL